MADEIAKKKILIIDDDTFLLDMYSLKFSQSGYAVDTALGSDQAYEKMKKDQPQISFLLILLCRAWTDLSYLKNCRQKNY